MVDADSSEVDFALTEAAYIIVRLVNEFPTIAIPDDEVPETIGEEKQVMTLVMLIADGCRVTIK